MLKFEAEAFASGNHFGGYHGGGRQVGEEKKHRQAVIEVSEGVDKGRIALANNMVEGVVRLSSLFGASSVAFETSSVLDVATAKGLGNLLFERLLVAELLDKRLMQQILDILGVVKRSRGRRGLGNLLLAARLARVDALPDA